MLIFRRRGLIGYFPAVTLTILVACLVGFVVELSLERGLAEFLFRYGFVPLQAAAFVSGVDGATFMRGAMPFFSSLLLHTGLFHLLINIWYLWMLGDVLEAWLGRLQYAGLLLAGAAVHTLTGLVVNALSSGTFPGVPSIGISGAVTALIGGYAAVLVMLLRMRRGSKDGSFLLWVPMALGLVGWFPLQWLNGVLSLPVATCQNSRPVAWISLGASAFLGVLVVGISHPRQRFVAEEEEPPEDKPSDEPPEPLRWDV